MYNPFNTNVEIEEFTEVLNAEGEFDNKKAKKIIGKLFVKSVVRTAIYVVAATGIMILVDQIGNEK